MAQKLSGKMAISIDSSTLEYIYKESAGHPYMYRELAKLAVNSLNNRIAIIDNPGMTRHLNTDDVTSNLMEWKLSVSDLISNNRIQLEKYYTNEFLLLEILSEGKYDDFLRESEHYDVELFRLMKLGAVYKNSEGVYEISKIILKKGSIR